jgi:hypothetical protein
MLLFLHKMNLIKVGEKKWSTENRIWQQFILKNDVGNIKIRHRYRLEQRWIKLEIILHYNL